MKCPMYDSCTLRTGGCLASLPDNGCYWYRWFKDLIQKTENPWNTGMPKEEGRYLAVIESPLDEPFFVIATLRKEPNRMVWQGNIEPLAWQKIEPYKEKEK